MGRGEDKPREDHSEGTPEDSAVDDWKSYIDCWETHLKVWEMLSEIDQYTNYNL